MTKTLHSICSRRIQAARSSVRACHGDRGSATGKEGQRIGRVFASLLRLPDRCKHPVLVTFPQSLGITQLRLLTLHILSSSLFRPPSHLIFLYCGELLSPLWSQYTSELQVLSAHSRSYS